MVIILHCRYILSIGLVSKCSWIKVCHLKCLSDSQDYQIALKRFSGSLNDPVSLYLNYATIAPLPDQASRHNAPSRPHALTKVVKSQSFDVDGETIVVSFLLLIEQLL